MMKLFEDLEINHLNGYLILLDIDGTIANDSDKKINHTVLKKISRLRNQNDVYLCSNSRDHKRNRDVSRMTKIDYLETDLRKPRKKILDLIDRSEHKKKLVIGDKFLTDGLFAKNIKADFIKVKRIESDKDKFYIKFLYWIDDLISRLIS